MVPTLELAARTDCGRVRANNEDCVATAPEIGLAVLADGMGGHNAGEVASELAVRFTMQSLAGDWPVRRTGQTLSTESRLVAAIEEANGEVFRAAHSQHGCHGMGTTLVAALWDGAHVSIAHVGDSRAYRLRNGKLALLTHDHTEVRQQFESGLITLEQTRTAPNRNVLTRAVGIAANVEVEVRTHEVVPLDVYLLCSDGVYDMLSDRFMEQLLQEAAPAAALADAIVQAANAAGGFDNVSAIVARVDSLPFPGA
jgi:serine/threonine protein phosphatase PrpC